MGQLLNIVTKLHASTIRDYLARMVDDKIHCMQIAKKYEGEYWDGDRRYGYGGYKYDGRHKQVAIDIIKQYNLQDDCKILDVGCGKAYLLYELKQLLPNAEVAGFDSSQYAIDNAKKEIKDDLFVHKAEEAYPFKDNSFDLVISFATLHNLKIQDIKTAVQEIERVGDNKFIMVEAHRNETELFNLECWALTCESFFQPIEWIWLYKEWGYSGDYEFIYFE
jgi:ubiquinone/menaquinone biosynthesis C-methylase UbiE